jgi:glyoxylase-like metal-dependent hydrolase (beta-lactamase superfamily II)
MIHEILPVGRLACNCSIFGDEQTRKAIVVDPGDDIDIIQEVLDRHGLQVQAIVITHAHIDHIGGAAKLKRLTGAPVWMNAQDQALYDEIEWQASWLGMRAPEQTEIDVPAKDGDALELGDIRFEVRHTPGHTQGSLCLYAADLGLLVAGDTLFRDSVGRTDLPGGDHRSLLRSISEKLLVLPDDTQVICGHGSGTTIGRERERNPFLRGL